MTHEKLVDLVASVLHDHGPTHEGPQTGRWQDCPRATPHGGAAAAIVAALDRAGALREVGR